MLWCDSVTGKVANTTGCKRSHLKAVASHEACVELPGPSKLKCRCTLNPLAKHAKKLLVFGCRQQEGRPH